MKSLVRAMGLVCTFGVLAAGAQAVFVIELTTLINGQMPTGTAPFARATFTNAGANTVTLKMENLLNTSGADITGWLFNVNLSPADISGMTFTHVSGQVVQATNGVVFGSNSQIGPDGSTHGGLFDIMFDFPPPPGADKFLPGEVSIWTITGNGLTETSFDSESVDGAHPGGWRSAIRIQGFDDVDGNRDSSGSLGDGGENPQDVPEPFTMALMGGAAIAGYRRLKRKNSK